MLFLLSTSPIPKIPFPVPALTKVLLLQITVVFALTIAISNLFDIALLQLFGLIQYFKTNDPLKLGTYQTLPTSADEYVYSGTAWLKVQ